MVKIERFKIILSIYLISILGPLLFGLLGGPGGATTEIVFLTFTLGSFLTIFLIIVLCLTDMQWFKHNQTKILILFFISVLQLIYILSLTEIILMLIKKI